LRPVNRRLWERRKEEFHRRMVEDREIGYLDPGIEEVLEEFFRRPKAYTTSSCSGRVTIVDAPWPWSRDESSIVYRSHSPVSVEEVEGILRQKAVHTLWLIAAGPIIHVETMDMEEAFSILEAARQAGFKHSGILSASGKGFLVELQTGVRMTIPLKTGEKLLVSPERLPLIVEMANRAVAEGRRRLERLKEELGKRK